MRRGLTMEDLGDLAELRLLTVLATYQHDGTVLLSPVWHEWREGGFGVITSSRDVKAAHLREIHGPASWSVSMPRRTAESRYAATSGSSPQESAMRWSGSPPAILAAKPEPRTR